MKGQKNNSGIILLSVLWILAILSMLALSLARSAGMEVSLMHYSMARVRANAAAWAGINYSLNSLSKQGSQKDTLYSSGVAFKNAETPEDHFKNIKVIDQVHFDVDFIYRDGKDKKAVRHYGFTDDLRRINLNSLNGNNFLVLSFLLQNLGVERSLSDGIAAATLDWRDEDTEPFNSGGVQGAENEYYGSLTPPFQSKNKSFDVPEELMLVKGMTPEIFAKVRDYITVFPKLTMGNIQINLNTAPPPVYNAVFRLAADQQRADSLMYDQAVQQVQEGKDGVLFTADDAQTPPADALAQFNLAAQAAHHSERSQYYRIRSTGTDEPSGVRATIEAVVSLDDRGEQWVVQSWNRLN